MPKTPVASPARSSIPGLTLPVVVGVGAAAAPAPAIPLDVLTGAAEEAASAADIAEPAPIEISRRFRLINLGAVVVPLAAVVTAIALAWGSYFRWVDLALLVGMYYLSGIGITVGFHRFFTHKSFNAVRPLQWFLGVTGSMAVQGDLVEWVAWHRKHHQHSDTEHDPHSPHFDEHGEHGTGIRGLFKGLYHAHMGWMIRMSRPERERYAPDLIKDPMFNRIGNQFNFWVVVSLIIPAVIGGLWDMSWFGALLGFLWGGLVRVFLVHHITWSINSVCHVWGARDFVSHDHSRNNPIFGILAFGEGWHNNHHAFPTSARHGLRWWQFDSSWIIIRTFKLLGLASDLKVPSAERQASKLRRTAA
jgi:stearoyl-CoA desaturase (Delta-9 desaturase)